jgi:hypothetical protein
VVVLTTQTELDTDALEERFSAPTSPEIRADVELEAVRTYIVGTAEVGDTSIRVGNPAGYGLLRAV